MDDKPSREPGLLPRGWAKTLLVLALVLLGLAYWIGMHAEGPNWDEPPPTEVDASPPPAPQPE